MDTEGKKVGMIVAQSLAGLIVLVILVVIAVLAL
jgi:hypothetical protein